MRAALVNRPLPQTVSGGEYVFRIQPPRRRGERLHHQHPVRRPNSAVMIDVFKGRETRIQASRESVHSAMSDRHLTSRYRKHRPVGLGVLPVRELINAIRLFTS